MKKIFIIISIMFAFVTITNSQNIYTSNGTLIGDRVVNMKTNSMCFSNNGSLLGAGNSAKMSGFALRGATGGKYLDKGVGLEFVLPVDTDGNDFWSFSRIITIPENTKTSNATGKIIFGTRRVFNKYGTGSQWYFGDDLVIDGVGNLGIGTLSPQAKLDVRGKIIADEVQIKVNKGADFVFDPNYELKPLSEVDRFVEQNKHLPDIPSEKEMIENGVNVNELQIKLLQKIEELTLYTIQQQKQLDKQNAQIEQLLQLAKDK